MKPIGFAPGLKVFSAGDVYAKGDIITIGANNWLVMPNTHPGCGQSDLLFKVS
jgi:hypothetical protein